MKASQFVQSVYNIIITDALHQCKKDYDYFCDLIYKETKRFPGIFLAMFNTYLDDGESNTVWKLGEAWTWDDFFYKNDSSWDPDTFYPFGSEFIPPRNWFARIEDMQIDWEKAEELFGKYFTFSGDYTLVQQPAAGCDPIFYVYERYRQVGTVQLDLMCEVYDPDELINKVLS